MNFKCKLRTSLIFIVIITVLFTTITPALALTAGEITQGLTCICGCNMVVSACEGSMECGPAKEITDQIIQMIEKGRSKENIIQYFVGTHGEKILAAPTKKGFNLTAWILPFIAIILGAGVIYIFIDKSLISRKDAADGLGDSGKKQTIDKSYLDLFERELKNFEL
jgi:cytochrome c-type biogenesis protein CcmH